jgi:REP element-mobilizing transposase RayT
MASYTKLLVHLVWSTKLREPMIDDALKVRLHSYLSARCQEFGCLALAVGGVADHVHLLVRLHPDVAVARLARELKAPSTRFVHRVFKREGFAWQDGYGAFTLRETESDVVRLYVLGQERHHASGSVVEEWERSEEPWEGAKG